MHTRRVDCLILGLHGVVVSREPRRLYERIARHCEPPAGVAAQLEGLVDDPNLVRDRSTLRDVHALLAAQFGLRLGYEPFARLWREPHSEPVAGMRALLHGLSRRCRLVLLGTVDRAHWPTVRDSLPELARFHAQVLSFEQGIAPPEPQAFLRACTAGGIAIERCRLVDARPANVEAAAGIGLAGQVFEGTRALKAALRGLGLDPD